MGGLVTLGIGGSGGGSGEEAMDLAVAMGQQRGGMEFQVVLQRDCLEPAEERKEERERREMLQRERERESLLRQNRWADELHPVAVVKGAKVHTTKESPSSAPSSSQPRGGPTFRRRRRRRPRRRRRRRRRRTSMVMVG
jgi:hypothetical protein